MRILNAGHFNHVRAGSDRYMVQVGEMLEADGHTVIPFATQHEDNRDSEWAEYFPPGVDTENPSLRDLGRFLYSQPARTHLERLLEAAPPLDLAHLHIYYGQLTTSILQPLVEAGIPVVQSLHEYKLTCPVYTHVSGGDICEACQGSQFWRALPRKCNRGSLARTALSVLESYVSRSLGDNRHVDHFLASSDFMREKMVEHDVVAPEDVSTVYNFVDPDRFQVSDEPGAYVLYFGRIAPVKGLRTLIDAAAPLDDVPVLIAGTGGQRDELEAEIERRGLDHIRFVGFQRGEDLWDLVRGSLCTVLPSEWYENCPMAVLESFACGRAVVGAEIGGIPELIDHGSDGRLFPSGNVEALREVLAWMSAHPQQAADMGRAGRRTVETQFSPGPHYDDLWAAYDEVL